MVEDFRGLLLRFRGRTRLTQTQLAERAGVHPRSVQAWEAGINFPSAERLQATIVALLDAGGFTSGREADEAAALWAAADLESSRQRPPFDARWFAKILATRQTPPAVAARTSTTPDLQRRTEEESVGGPSQDWGDAPDSAGFVGRHLDLERLRRVVTQDRARLLVLSGMGGIGKTTTAARMSREIAPEFQRVYWRSVRDAPTFEDWSEGAIGFVADHQMVAPDGDHARTELLVELMRERRCLVVLDNLEALLQSGQSDFGFRPDFDGYARFLEAIGERDHRSCVVLTSREVPLGLVHKGARVVELGGLELVDAQLLVSDKRLDGDDQAWAELVMRNGGNGLALRIVGDVIRQVFAGDIAAFLEQVPAGAIFGGMRRLFDSQFARLSPVELDILRLLAIAREPHRFTWIASQLVTRANRVVVLEAIEALRHRSLIEASGVGFTLQSVVLEYVTEQLVESAAAEIETRDVSVLANWPVLQAQAKDFVRRAQESLIARALLERVVAAVGGSTEAAAHRLLTLLDQLRERNPQEQGYGPGNIINLLRLLQGNLRGINLSGLSIREAYLQDVEAQDANLAGAMLSESVLDDAFGTIGSVAVSADAARVAAGTLEGAVRVWRTADRAPLVSARGHLGAVWGVSLSGDGSQMASGGIDGVVRLWDVAGGESESVPQDFAGGVARVVLSLDGRLLAIAGFDGTIRLWDTTEHAVVGTFVGHNGAVYGLAVSDSKQLLASSGLDGTVRLWDIPTQRQLMELLGHQGAVWSVALDADGARVVSGGRDGTVRLWNSATGSQLGTFAGHVGAVRAVAISPDGQTTVSGGFDGTVRLWDSNSGRRLAALHGHTGGVRGVAISGDGQTIVSGGFDGAVRLWDAAGGLLLATLQGHTAGVRGVAISSDGRKVAGSGPDATIRLWEISTGELLAKFEGHTGSVRAIAMSGDDRIIASSGLDGSVRLWHAQRGEPLGVLEGHTAGTLAVAVSWDGSVLASAGLDGTVRLWDTASRQCRSILEGHSGAVWYVALSADAHTLGSCGVDGTVRIWAARSGELERVLVGHKGGVRSLSFSADSQTLVSSGDDSLVRVWDVGTGSCFAVLEGHAAAVYGVAVSPDAETIASASFDGTVRLWEAKTGRSVAVLDGHTDAVYDVVINADGRTVASCSLDGTVKLWDRASLTLLRTLRPDRRYERMDITGLSGVTQAQRSTLLALGAVERTS